MKEEAFSYRVVRSPRKTLCLQITREGEIVVRAPQLCGEERIAAFVKEHEGWLQSHLPCVLARAEEMRVSPEEEARLRRLASEVLPQRTAYYAAQMGVFPAGIRITSARGRYGSCSTQNRICYSWRLMQLPDDLVDYVVVHELAHIREHNHSAAFYRVVASVLPDYRARERRLRAK